MAQTIKEAKASQAAVQLYDQLPSIATSLNSLKQAVDRATGFKGILIANGDEVTVATMLGEVSTYADQIWGTTEADLKVMLDVVAGMLPDPANPGQPHTRDSLLDTLKTTYTPPA